MRHMLLVAVFVVSCASVSAGLVWSDGTAAADGEKSTAYDVFRGTSAAVAKETEADGEKAAPGSREGAFSFTASVLTTCTGLVSNYPRNAVNYFYPEKHSDIYYFAYILIFPPHSGSHLVLNEWYDADGKLICSRQLQAEITLEDNYISLAGNSYLYYLFINSIGMKEIRGEHGQTALPGTEGLYHIRLLIDGQLVGTTFFRVIKGGGGHPMEKLEELRHFLKRRQGKEGQTE